MAEIDRSLRYTTAFRSDRPACSAGTRSAFGTLGERAADLRGGP